MTCSCRKEGARVGPTFTVWLWLSSWRHWRRQLRQQRYSSLSASSSARSSWHSGGGTEAGVSGREPCGFRHPSTGGAPTALMVLHLRVGSVTRWGLPFCCSCAHTYLHRTEQVSVLGGGFGCSYPMTCLLLLPSFTISSDHTQIRRKMWGVKSWQGFMSFCGCEPMQLHPQLFPSAVITLS